MATEEGERRGNGSTRAGWQLAAAETQWTAGDVRGKAWSAVDGVDNRPACWFVAVGVCARSKDENGEEGELTWRMPFNKKIIIIITN